MIPVFPMLPEISFLQAVGIMLFISLFRNKSQTVIEKSYRNENKEWAITLLSPWLTLFSGWIVNIIINFMMI